MTKAKAAAEKKPDPRSKFSPTFIRRAERLSLLGCTDDQMAAAFDVARSTFYLWKKEYPKFAAAIRGAKVEADAEVAVALRQRAIGYSHSAVKILQHNGTAVIVPYTERFPPDPQAAMCWLFNRQPALWRRAPTDQGGDEPAPVRVVVEVKDGRIRPDDAVPQSPAG